MAKLHHETEPTPFLSYEDGWIETMRINGYRSALPYVQCATLTPAEERAYNKGRVYLFERNCQADHAAAVKAGMVDKPGKPSSPEWLQAYAQAWKPKDGELPVVSARRAEIAAALVREKFPSADEVRILASVPVFLAHVQFADGRPGHAIEIARRLAADFSTYIPPKKRDAKGGGGDLVAAAEAFDPEAA